MDKHTEIEEFARILMEWVRDETIRNCDRVLHDGGTDPIAKRWREAAGNDRPERILEVAIPDIVDATIANLFRAIDQEALPLAFKASNQATVDLPRDGLGELCGWYMGEWRAQYSKERLVDNFADLEGQFDEGKE